MYTLIRQRVLQGKLLCVNCTDVTSCSLMTTRLLEGHIVKVLGMITEYSVHVNIEEIVATSVRQVCVRMIL